MFGLDGGVGDFVCGCLLESAETLGYDGKLTDRGQWKMLGDRGT